MAIGVNVRDYILKQVCAALKCAPSLYHPVHFRGGLFGLLFVHVEDLEGEGIAAEGYRDGVAGLDFPRGFCRLAVDLDTSAGARFRGNGAAFYDARNFEKFVDTHIFTCFLSAFTGGRKAADGRGAPRRTGVKKIADLRKSRLASS